MSLNLIQNFSIREIEEKALENRVKEDALQSYTPGEVIEKSDFYRKNVLPKTLPVNFPGSVITSSDHNSYIMDVEYECYLINNTLNMLSNEIEKNKTRIEVVLSNVKEEIDTIEKTLFKSGSQVEQVFFKVDESQGVFFDKKLKRTITDLNGNFGNKITLPVKQEIKIKPYEVNILKEETDFGDTWKPIVTSPVSFLLKEGNIFRHVIIRQQHNKTSKRFRYEHSNLCLLFSFGLFRRINKINIRLGSVGSLEIEELKYLDIDGNYIDIDIEEKIVKSDLVLLFQTVQASEIKIKFKQRNITHKGVFNSSEIGGYLNEEINQRVQSMGFENLIPNTTIDIEGRVYDFSINSIDFSYCDFLSVGLFRSNKKSFKKPLSFRVFGNESFSGKEENENFFLDRPYCEYYLELKGVSENSNILFEETVPVPLERHVRESLPHFEETTVLSFYPDLINDALVISSHDDALVLGSDYLVSLDGGANFFSTVPGLIELVRLKERAEAGRCVLKLLTNKFQNINATYLIEEEQKLTTSTKLKRGKVYITKACDAIETQLVIILRNENSFSEYTPIVENIGMEIIYNVS